MDIDNANYLFKLDFNERSDNPPAWLAQAEVNTDKLWRYPNRVQLEQSLSNDLGIPPDAILLTNGGDEGIDLLFKSSTINKTQLLIPEPCFSQYSHNAKIWQNDCRFIAVDPQQPLTINQARLIENLNANQWLVVTRPNNPTGEFIPQQALLTLIKAAQEKRARVFIDEAYIEFAQPENNENMLAAKDYVAMDNVVVLRTFSKAFGLAGARVGYVLGSPELINAFRCLAPPFNVSRVSLQLASQAWQNREQVKAYSQQIATNRQRLTRQLCQYKMEVFPSQGNFVLFNTNPVMKTALLNVLKRYGILIKTKLNGLDHAVRITVPFDLTPLLTALKQIFEPLQVAFDMDGVLIDTTNSYDQCIIKTVFDLSGQNINQQDIQKLRDSGGYNNDWDLTLALLQNEGYTGDRDTVIEVFQNYYLGTEQQPGLIQQETPLISSEFINQLKQSSFKTSVVTGRPRAEASLGLQEINWQPDNIVSADDVSQQKPSPEGLLTLKKQGASGGHWFIGDTVDDMQAGRAAGFMCVGIGTDASLLLNAGADVVLDNVNQLESLL
ncbi:MAG: aminotransferase class I/II-fold pyridoxal phosphate-dependent enzyme [Proteobacteria bacterium]|nr:aminotransferase class I/II-fold pyridoxal phosphate-dependent enzyme [Pseudomonadota bacterium]